MHRGPRQLAIFDLDGTLARTNALDDSCFVAAIGQRLRIEVTDTDWSHYEHSTDEGLTREIWARTRRTKPAPEHIASVRSRFLSLMRRAAKRKPALLAPVAGAVTVLHRLQRRGWAVAIATGAWEESARFKLSSCGINMAMVHPPHAPGAPGAEHDIPLCCASSDHIARTEIISAAIQHSLAQYRSPKFDRMVVIGDGVWDACAAAALNLHFVGLRADGDESRLRAIGIRHILRDFAAVEHLADVLEKALVPVGVR